MVGVRGLESGFVFGSGRGLRFEGMDFSGSTLSSGFWGFKSSSIPKFQSPIPKPPTSNPGIWDNGEQALVRVLHVVVAAPPGSKHFRAGHFMYYQYHYFDHFALRLSRPKPIITMLCIVFHPL